MERSAKSVALPHRAEPVSPPPADLRPAKRWEGSLLPAAVLLLALAVAALPGCAGGGKGTPLSASGSGAAAAQAEPPAAPVVERLGGGREGFVIRERGGLDEESQSEFERGVALVRAEEFAKGAESLEKVLARFPWLVAPHVDAAIAYRGLNNPELAEKHLKAALELVAGHPAASNEYGLLLRKAGRFAEARAVYERSLSSFPEYHPLERNLAILCDLYLKDLPCAQEHYEIYSRAVPKDKQVTLWLADLQTRTGHLALQGGGQGR